MGFITRAFSVLAGSEEFPSGGSDALCRQRSEVLLTKSVQCIIDADQGWELDTNRNPTDTSYTDIPAMNNGQSMPGLFLRNNISGCKMFISYFGTPNIYSIKNFNNNSCLRTGQTLSLHSGLIISIIPENSESEFGDPSVEGTFIPNDATRLVGTAYASSISAAYKITNGWGYEYTFGVTPYCIFVYATHNEYGVIDHPQTYLAVPIYAVGRILESVAHNEKTINAKYGIISFRIQPDNYGYESWSYVFCQEFRSMSTLDYFTTVGTGIKNNNFGFTHLIDDISRVDGSWIGNAYNDHYKIMHFAINPNSLGLSQSSGNTAWSAIGIASIVNSNTYPSEIATYGVTPTDGFKGILDTTLFRAIANGTRGQTFDNDKFICPESNVGLLLGWNPENTWIGN